MKLVKKNHHVLQVNWRHLGYQAVKAGNGPAITEIKSHDIRKTVEHHLGKENKNSNSMMVILMTITKPIISIGETLSFVAH